MGEGWCADKYTAVTHYFQWINSIKLTPIGKERQATNYADYVLEDYAETREHP